MDKRGINDSGVTGAEGIGVEAEEKRKERKEGRKEGRKKTKMGGLKTAK